MTGWCRDPVAHVAMDQGPPKLSLRDLAVGEILGQQIMVVPRWLMAIMAMMAMAMVVHVGDDGDHHHDSHE